MQHTSRWKYVLVIVAIAVIFTTLGVGTAEKIPISDGFDYPVGIPDGTSGENGLGYYVIAGFGDTSYKGIPHLGEDWNSRECATCDLGDPVYAISNGFVRSALDTQIDEWKGVIIIDHISPSGTKFKIPNGIDATKVSSMYAHLDVTRINEWVNENEYVRRGQQIGVIGPTPKGSTGPHLHFELRDDTSIVCGPGYSWDSTGWIDPGKFINANRPKLVPLIGDWDGNTIDETGTFNPRISIFSWVAKPMGEPGDLPIVGDWDRDGIDTIGIYRPTTAEFHLDNNNDGIADQVIPLGDIGDFPIVGDWDGDGDDNIGVFRYFDTSRHSTMFFLNSDNSGVEADISIHFGIPTDIPIVGDWDADGIDDIGIFRKNDPDNQDNSVFYFDIGHNGDQAELEISYGINTDIPVIGKWDDDGLTKLGVYRPSTPEFIFNHSPLIDVEIMPTVVPTDTVSPIPDITPPDGTEMKEVIEVITSVVEETINRILDLLEKLL